MPFPRGILQRSGGPMPKNHANFPELTGSTLSYLRPSAVRFWFFLYSRQFVSIRGLVSLRLCTSQETRKTATSGRKTRDSKRKRSFSDCSMSER
jgi:hypothetical protein